VLFEMDSSMIRKSVKRLSEKDHAQTTTKSAMTVHPNLIALWSPATAGSSIQTLSGSMRKFGGEPG